MNIDPNAVICNLPALDARKLMQKLQHTTFDISTFKKHLGMNLEKTKQILNDFIGNGYLQESESHNKNKKSFSLTLQGSALALSSATKPFTRKAVETTFANFMNRILEINNSDDYLHKITKVIVFGSYLSKKERLGDLDVAVELKRKIEDPDLYMAAHDALIEKAKQQGVNFYSHSSLLSYPEVKTKKYLKNRSQIISLHNIDDEILKTCIHEVVFTAE